MVACGTCNDEGCGVDSHGGTTMTKKTKQSLCPHYCQLFWIRGSTKEGMNSSAAITGVGRGGCPGERALPEPVEDAGTTGAVFQLAQNQFSQRDKLLFVKYFKKLKNVYHARIFIFHKYDQIKLFYTDNYQTQFSNVVKTLIYIYIYIHKSRVLGLY